MEKDKQVKKLFRVLQSYSPSVFCAAKKIIKNLLKKAKSAAYDKDKIFCNLYEQLENKDFNKNKNLLLATPFIEKRSKTDRSTIYSLSKLFEVLQADIADIRFLAKSTLDPKYCVLFVDLFTSKIYVYPMKIRSVLARKKELFYNSIKDKRTGRMRLQTDKEFNPKKKKKLNKNFDVEMYSTNICGWKAYAAE